MKKPTNGGGSKGGNPRTARQARLQRQKKNRSGLIPQKPRPNGRGLIPTRPPKRKTPGWVQKLRISRYRWQTGKPPSPPPSQVVPTKPVQPGGTPKTEPTPPPKGWPGPPKPTPNETRSANAWWD